jgi:hypothetical protein
VQTAFFTDDAHTAYPILINDFIIVPMLLIVILF